MRIDHTIIQEPSGRSTMIWRLHDDKGSCIGCYGNFFDAEDALVEAQADQLFDSISLTAERPQ